MAKEREEACTPDTRRPEQEPQEESLWAELGAAPATQWPAEKPGLWDQTLTW